MGSKTCWQRIIWVMFFLSSVSVFSQPMNPSDSLDDFFRSYAQKEVIRLRTGILYNISLPSNFSGMEVSFVRLRTGYFWQNGANLSYFHIPPRILPVPYVKRFDFVYQNLGNWSSVYYNLPNFTLITPVVGLMLYDAWNTTGIGSSRLDLSVNRDPILIQFPPISLPMNVTMQCVRFGGNGSVEFSNMTLANSCIARNGGHFSIVVPSLPPQTTNKRRKNRFWRWWVLGFGLGIIAFILVGLLGFLTYRFVKKKRIGQMERQAERNEALDTTWVGRSRMPSATGIRTQPSIEDEYVP